MHEIPGTITNVAHKPEFGFRDLFCPHNLHEHLRMCEFWGFLVEFVYELHFEKVRCQNLPHTTYPEGHRVYGHACATRESPAQHCSQSRDHPVNVVDASRAVASFRARSSSAYAELEISCGMSFNRDLGAAFVVCYHDVQSLGWYIRPLQR